MEEEEVEELEECETEELEELEEDSSGSLQSIPPAGRLAFLIFCCFFWLKGKPTNYTKTKNNIGCVAGRVCVICVCVFWSESIFKL